MNERKYEIMEAHLKGELTVMDLIDKIVELEGIKQLHEIKHTYEVKEYVFDSRQDAQKVLLKLADYADKYATVPVALYYEILGDASMYVDNSYGWSYDSIRRKASVERYENKYYNRYDIRKYASDRYVIKFPPVEVL